MNEHGLDLDVLNTLDETTAEMLRNHTTLLQHEYVSEGRLFSSYMVSGVENRDDVYCSVDAVDLNSAIPDIKSNMDLRVGFLTTVTKNDVSISVTHGMEMVSSMHFSNVKSADDYMKLVSFCSSEFVDPLLKDFNTIKKILGN